MEFRFYKNNTTDEHFILLISHYGILNPEIALRETKMLQKLNEIKCPLQMIDFGREEKISMCFRNYEIFILFKCFKMNLYSMSELVVFEDQSEKIVWIIF